MLALDLGVSRSGNLVEMGVLPKVVSCVRLMA